jgi:hypothetical protein
MAEPRKLHSGGTHVAMRGLFGLTLAMGLFAVTAFVVNRSTELADVLACAFFIAFPTIIGRIVLRTRPVWLDGDYLEVGRGDRRRRVHCLDVVEAEHPHWAFSDDKAMLPLKVTLRGAKPVFFFPAYGAKDLIFGARRHARDLAEAQGASE